MIALKRIRQERNLTQTQLGEILGVQKTAVSKWENGENVMNSVQIVKLCEALNVRADELLGIEERYKK